VKKSIKRGLSLLLCCVILLAFAACKKTDAPATTTPPAGGATANPDAPSGGGDAPAEPPATSVRDTLNVAVSGDTGSLEPTKVRSANFLNVTAMFAEPLFDTDGNGDKVWILATGIDKETPTKWIVHLREGVSFTNGNPFTAEDALFSFYKLNHDPASPALLPTLNEETTKVLDEYTLEMNFTAFDVTTEANIGTVRMYDSESYVDEEYSQSPTGTGPYIVTEYVVGSHVHMKANDNYWGGRAKITNLNFSVLTEPAQIINAIELGTVDVATVPIQDVDFVKGLSEYNVSLFPTTAVDVAIFNTTTSSVFNSRDARKAASYAIDKDAIASLVYYGYASIPTWPNAMNLLDYDDSKANLDDTYTTGYNVELGKEYAEKAGIVGKSVIIATTGSTEAVTMAEIIQQNLKVIGIDASINNYDSASWVSVAQDPEMYDMFLTVITNPSKLGIQNYGGYFIFLPTINQGTWEGKDRYKEILDVVQGTSDAAEYAAMVKELTEIHTRESIWYAIDQPLTAFAVNTALGGVAFMRDYNAYYGDWYWVS
jgi:peptide/nickel transport system substrate-binding protein